MRGISLTVEQGSSYGLVGESGCGKSTVALSIVRYLPRNGRVVNGSLEVAGRNVLALRGDALRLYRRDVVSMVYQNPGAALNPTLRVGRQVEEVFALRGARRDEARERAMAALREVHIADPDSVLRRYPHQLSGGMQQRVVIAMALATDPSLLILDEPTTGLDATVEAEVIDLIAELQVRHQTAVLFISHNLGLIRKACRTTGVLYAGELVEEGPTDAILHDPRHPYTVGLLRCIPRGGLRKDRGKLDTIPGFLPPIGASLPGCVFVHRCGLAEEICATDKPPDYDVGAGSSEPLPLPRARAAAPARHGVDPGRASDPRRAGRRRCSRSTSSPRPSSRTAGISRRSQASRRRCGRARRSGSSASREAARRPSRGRCSGSSSRARARSRSTVAGCRRGSTTGRPRTSRRSRSSSRTPTRRSTGATRCVAC